MTVKQVLLCGAAVVALGGGVSASGGAQRTGVGAAATELTLRIANETAPAGSMVQMKVLTTEVTPISAGRPGFYFDPTAFSSVAGFGLFAPGGETAAAAVINGTRVDVAYTSTATLTANYPILTVVLPIRSDAVAGSKTLFTLDPASVWNYSTLGPVGARINPGIVTIGGTVAITDVIPGEGVWPAGTMITIRGVGFDAKTKVSVNDVANKGFTVASPTEIQFALPTTMDVRGMRITASGPQNSVTYYAYMRGLTTAVSARPLLALTEPIFATAQRAVATLGAVPALTASQYFGVALQNPNMSPVSVTLTLNAADGSVLHQTSLTLDTRGRLALDAAELLDGVVPPAGSLIVVAASAPIDAISLLCDEAAWTVSPALPLEALR